jgi:ankyrin repeat protein
VRLLLRLGADPNRRLHRDAVDWTPLAVAIEQFNRVAIDALLAAGADPNARWCVPVRSLYNAQQRGKKPGCDLRNGITPLMFAASAGHDEIVAALLEHGADRSLADWTGRTALDYAATERRDKVRALLR